MQGTEHNNLIVPTMADPRLLLMVPAEQRAAVDCLWRLEARLCGTILHRREDMLAQIKLAWWRDRLVQLAEAPSQLPRGEPLLAELAQYWAGNMGVSALVDGYEAAMFAATANEGRAAAEQLAGSIAPLIGASNGSSSVLSWGLVRAGQLATSRSVAEPLWAEAAMQAQAADAPRAVQALGRWATLAARQGGVASPRSEAWLLLRAGLGF
jgi:15-cis-phytoene synthase